MSSVDDLRSRLEHLKLTIEAIAAGEDLEELIEYWESLSPDEQLVKVDREIDDLQYKIQAYIDLTRPRKLANSPEIKMQIKDMRSRVDRLNSVGSALTIPTSTTPDSLPPKTIAQSIKSRTLPLPTYSGDLSDWRSFWRRFKDYLARLPDLSADEQLTFLLECVKDTTAISIIRDALRNGDSFESVERRLNIHFDQPRRVYTDMALKLKCIPEFSDTVKGTASCSEMASKFINIIENLGDGTASQLLTAFFEAMLDDSLTQEWYRYIGTSDAVSKVDKLIQFMDHRNRILTSKPVDARSNGVKSTPSYNKLSSGRSSAPSKPVYRDKSKSFTLIADNSLCKLCSERNHPLYYCSGFKQMSVSDRKKHVISSNRCSNCLTRGHSAKQCHSKKVCLICSGKHHSLLHLNEAERGANSLATSGTDSTTSPRQENYNAQQTSLALPVPRPTAILWICQAIVKQNDKTVGVRGIIDPGSTVSFLTEKIAKTLKLKTSPALTEVTGIGSTHAGTCKKEAEILIYSPYEHNAVIVRVRAAIISSIIGNTPSTDFLKKVDTTFTNSLNLSDPNFGIPGGFDLLLGQDVLRSILQECVVRSSKNDLYAINTIFGWVVGGCCESNTEAASTHVCCYASTSSSAETDRLLKSFWESEEPPTANFNRR